MSLKREDDVVALFYGWYLVSLEGEEQEMFWRHLCLDVDSGGKGRVSSRLFGFGLASFQGLLS